MKTNIQHIRPAREDRLKSRIIVTLLLAVALRVTAQPLTLEPATTLPDYSKTRLATIGGARVVVNAVSVADFNKDGRMDAVATTVSTAEDGPHPLGMAVILQKSDGTFYQAHELIRPSTSQTWVLIPMDLNGDGHLDVVLDELGNDLFVHYGTGEGGFAEARPLGLAAPGFPVVADFDGDQHLDIAAGSLEGNVQVFAGDGKGGFVWKSTLNSDVWAYRPRSGQILVGDINRDGKPDLAVASHRNQTLDVYLGNGDGTFKEVVRTPNIASWRGALGDFNGDGVLDYAGDRDDTKRLEIWLGRGDGRFTRGSTYSLANFSEKPVALMTVDLNGDQLLDLVISGEETGSAAAPLSLFMGNGDGTFRPRQTLTGVDNAHLYNNGPALADLNGDGLPDLVAVSYAASFGARTNVISAIISREPRRDTSGALLVSGQPKSPGPVFLETSANLVDWTVLATNNTSSLKRVVDGKASSQQFFRLR